MKSWRTGLGRLWIFLVIFPVLAVGGLVIYRLHGVFGSQVSLAGRGGGSEIIPTIPKSITYEIYGSADATGMVSYVDVRAQSDEAQFTSLPWSLTLTTTNSSVFANIIAQGDSQELGCRITVNGEVRDEQQAKGHNAAVFCLVKAA